MYVIDRFMKMLMITSDAYISRIYVRRYIRRRDYYCLLLSMTNVMYIVNALGPY